MVLRNTGILTLYSMSSLTRTPRLESSPPWKPQTWHQVLVCC